MPERLRVLKCESFFSVVKVCKHWLVEEQYVWRRVATQISKLAPRRRGQTDFQLFYRDTWLQLGYFETPLLEIFFHWFSRGTFCRIGWSYRARCKQKGKCMPPGTSSPATGQSSSLCFPSCGFPAWYLFWLPFLPLFSISLLLLTLE